MLELKSASMENASTVGVRFPISVIIPVRNEARNLPRCLDALRDFGEVCVIDSQSTDETVDIARAYGAQVVQFHYPGGWPKKRQWAMDSLPLKFDWILLLDADEIITPDLANEMKAAIQSVNCDGYYAALQMSFLGRVLRHGDASFWKMVLFRRGGGRFECRLKDQNASMADMEIHEHVVVRGETKRLRNPIIHRNLESLSRYIEKHNEYSNWESHVLAEEELAAGETNSDLPPSLVGSQAQRRRWLKKTLYRLPGSPIALFLYRYIFRLGFLDGIPGLIYCSFQAIQMFHTKAKIYELRNTITDTVEPMQKEKIA
jgi:glycosyltransferase involved in cell wall biosynthesis